MNKMKNYKLFIFSFRGFLEVDLLSKSNSNKDRSTWYDDVSQLQRLSSRYGVAMQQMSTLCQRRHGKFIKFHYRVHLRRKFHFTFYRVPPMILRTFFVFLFLPHLVYLIILLPWLLQQHEKVKRNCAEQFPMFHLILVDIETFFPLPCQLMYNSCVWK